MIAVIGASSSGLYAAWLLAQAGHQVRLYERAPVEQSHPRRLIVTSSLLRFLAIPENLVLHHVDAFEFFADGHRGYIQLKTPDLIIERRDLIEWLATKARKNGVDIREGWIFSGFSLKDGKGVTVRLHNTATGRQEAIQLAVLIGADGAQSAVREALGPECRLPTVSLLQAKIHLPRGYPPHLVRIWFKRETTPYFFWLIPDSPKTGVVGVIVDDGEEAQQALDGFIRQMGWAPFAYEGGYASLYVPGVKPEARRGRTRIFLVGDAAGQVKATTVGGTIAGLRGAAVCAQAIVKGTSYWEKLALLRRELWVHSLIRRFLHPLDDRHYGEFLSSLNGRGAFLGGFSRDEVSSHFLPLLLKHPGFSLKGLRAMVKGI